MNICTCTLKKKFQSASFSKKMGTVISRTHNVSIGIRRSRSQAPQKSKSNAHTTNVVFANLAGVAVNSGMDLSTCIPHPLIREFARTIC